MDGKWRPVMNKSISTQINKNQIMQLKVKNKDFCLKNFHAKYTIDAWPEHKLRSYYLHRIICELLKYLVVVEK